MKNIHNSEALGTLIRAERKKQKLTQQKLSALSGVGVRFIRELEHGKESCHIGLALQVMQTLGLSLTVSTRGEQSS